MKIINILSAILLALSFLALAGTCSHAATSSNYAISAEVLDAGGATAESLGYRLLGKLRDKEVNMRASANYSVAEGFLRSIFFGAVLNPVASSINPNSGYNDNPSITVTITGSNFTGIPSIEIRMVSQPDIVGAFVNVIDSQHMTCRFNLVGAVAGVRTVYINGIATSVTFTVNEAPLKIVGPVYNYPNPFNPRLGPTLIKYVLTQNSDIVINLYNISGERVWSRRFISGTNGGQISNNAVPWDGLNLFSADVPNGVYVCQIMTAGGRTLAIAKIAVLR